jgi:cobyrinic acid a,c-diamide synthase
VEASVDIERLVSLGRTTEAQRIPLPVLLPPLGQRIALASDQAFSFVHPHVLTVWKAAGAEIVPFSLIAEKPPPKDCDACWLSGGNPERHAGRIAAPQNFLQGLRAFALTPPAHGECGGYMDLGEELNDSEGHAHRMAGLLPVSTKYAKRKLHLGYRVARLLHGERHGRRARIS